MDAATRIRDALGQVDQLRAEALSDPALAHAVHAVKALQARRFRASYADLLAEGPYALAARFFLEELYSERDYRDRDAQFGRIAGSIGSLFPQQVGQTAVQLAALHALTEALDVAVARAWLEGADGPDAVRYVGAWRAAGGRLERQRQLAMVMELGDDLGRLTRTPGLRLMLRMMRGPASAAGLAALQQFLEAGFDTFGVLARREGAVAGFLGVVQARESGWLESLFDAPVVAVETSLAQLLGQAP